MAVMTGAVDTDMSRDFQGPKSSPVEVAEAVISGLQRGKEEVYLGEMPTWINPGLAKDAKAVEREFAKYLPA